MPVTLKDIAERVGKSIPTVSRALGGFEDISPITRAEVQRVAREMGYEPSVTARNLQKQQTATIALILPTVQNLRFSDPFFSELLSGLVERTAERGFDLTVSIDTQDDPRQTYLKHIRSRRADGFVLVRTQRHDARIDVLREHDVPFVAFGRTTEENDFPFVDEDGTAGIRQVVDLLVELGHTRLGCIAEPTRFTKSYHRVQGFLEGLAAHHLAFEPELLVETNFRQRSGRQGAQHLLAQAEPPTAIVACNDLLALGAMSHVQEQGLVVGHDVSITGFDDILLAEYANPALTTVHQSAYTMGAMVAGLLLDIIEKKPLAHKQFVVQPTLTVRQSTGAPAAGRRPI